MRVFALVRSIPLGMALLGMALLGLGCPPKHVDPEPEHDLTIDRERPDDSDPRLDPTRCSGGDLDLRTLAEAGVCTIDLAKAGPLPGPEQLVIEVPDKLRVEPGGRLDFELLLRNVSGDALTLDLAFRGFLPLAPERTEPLEKGSVPDPSCILHALSTEPPAERIDLPVKGEIAIPCAWFANTRLIDPSSYVGVECPDFPALAPGRYRSVFVLGGGGGSSREVSVEIVVRAP
jgi:hypothetical protein